MISGGIHPLIETFDPIGCRRADRHCDHLQVANRRCRNRSDSLGEISLTDVALVVGKGANLGELTTAGLPVPPSFVVTATAYLDAVSESGAGVARTAAGRA